MRVFIVILALSISSLSNLLADKFSSDFIKYSGHRTTVSAVKYFDDGKKIAAIGGKGEFIIWERASRKILKRIPINKTKPVNFMSIDDKGKYAAVVGFADKAVTIIDINKGQIIGKIVASRSEYSVLKFLPRTKKLLIAGIDIDNKMVLSLWDVGKLKKLKTIYKSPYIVEREYISALDFSSDGKLCVFGASNTTHGFKIIDMVKFHIMAKRRTKGDISAIKFSSSNKYIITGGTDKIVKVWNTKGAFIRQMKGKHSGYITSLDIDLKDRFIASVGFDNGSLFKIWDFKTGELVQNMESRSPTINYVTFSPNGESLIIALTTYGNLFKVGTVREYVKYASVSRQLKNYYWKDLKLTITLLREPKVKISYKSDKYYSYSKIFSSSAGAKFDIDIVKYRYNISTLKISKQIKRSILNYQKQVIDRGGKLIFRKSYNVNGDGALESVVEVRRGRNYKRYHFKVIFANNILYRIRYISSDEEMSKMEHNFFNTIKID